MRYTINNLERSFLSAAVKRSSLILALITYLIVTLLVTAAAQAQDVSARIVSVERMLDNSRRNAVIAMVSLDNVQVHGRPISREKITFTLTGISRNRRLSIGIHEGDTVEQISKQVEAATTSISGLRTFQISHENVSQVSEFSDRLTVDDRRILLSVCSFLTQRRSLDEIIARLRRTQSDPSQMNYISIDGFFGGNAYIANLLIVLADRCVDEINAPIRTSSPAVRTVTPNAVFDPLQARISELEEQLSAANQTNVELREELTRLRPFGDRAGAAEAEVERLERQVGALNATIADMGTGTVSIVEHQAVRAQLAAANQTIVELRDNVADLTPSVGKAETAEAEVAMLQQQNAALNATIADLRRSTVSVSEHQEVEAQLDAANQTIVELQSRVNSLAPFVEAYRTEQTKNAELIQQVEALNATITDLRNSTVSVREHQEVQSQLAAANQTVVELRDRIGALDNVIQNLQRTVASTNDQLGQARQLVMSLQQTVVARDQQIDALNVTVTELRARMENDFVPLDRFNLSQAQLAALNATILELQVRNDLQRTRMVEAEAMFRNLRNDCAETPECARAMQLD